jgi:hypothetical protein
VLLMLAPVIVEWMNGDPRRRIRYVMFILGGLLIVSLPVIWKMLTEGYGTYLSEVWSQRNNDGEGGVNWFKGRYFKGLFWGLDASGSVYGPVWGGLLNPIAGSLLFLGAAELMRWRRRGWVVWTLTVPVLMVIAMERFGLEVFRILPVLPPVLLCMAVGLVVFLTGIPGRWRSAALVFLLCGSCILDFYHLAVAFPRTWNRQDGFYSSIKSRESLLAYRILKPYADRHGPGLLFLDFTPYSVMDPALGLATYPFNALQNPKWAGIRPSWAAVLLNVNYRPFLESRFSGCRWEILGSDLSPLDGELAMVLIPLETAEARGLESWRKIQPAFHRLTVNLAALPTGGIRQKALEEFSASKTLAKGDPFLESVYWENVYMHNSADKKFDRALGALTAILRKGYPAAHIYNELGGILWFFKDKSNARKAFQRAFRLGGEHTWASENLRVMDMKEAADRRRMR